MAKVVWVAYLIQSLVYLTLIRERGAGWSWAFRAGANYSSENHVRNRQVLDIFTKLAMYMSYTI